MVTKYIHARAPTRIDLAGGTLDIWPLYLFLKAPVTINLGIDLYAEATLETSSKLNEGQVVLKSEDQNAELKLSWKDFERSTPIHRNLELHFRLLKYFLEKKTAAGLFDSNMNLTLTTRAHSPSGAGLGGSSTLSIAMIGALSTWASNSSAEHPFIPQEVGEDFIQIVRDIETTVIQVPAGLQDYYGAMYGGLQTLRWGPGAHEHEWLPEELLHELDDRILLFYSGHSRNSGINNWALFKGFIDQQDEIRSKFEKISHATQQLEKALRSRDWIKVGEAIQEEWAIRKTLASGISTPEIDRAIASASELTPLSSKICGAGGGGCFFIYLPINSTIQRTELKTRIQKLIADQGMRPLEFHGVPRGLEVRVTRA